MVDLIKRFAKVTGDFFNFSEEKKVAKAKAEKEKNENYPIFKTRSQLIEEGKGAYIPKRHIHGIPTLNKLN